MKNANLVGLGLETSCVIESCQSLQEILLVFLGFLLFVIIILFRFAILVFWIFLVEDFFGRVAQCE